MTMPLVQQIIPQQGQMFDAAPIANLIGGYKKKLKEKKQNELRNQVAAGDQDATRQFITMNPEEGKKIIDAFGAMDENSRKATAEKVDKIGRIAHFILSGADDNERQQRYAYAKESAGQDIAGLMPDQYDPNFVQYHLSKATEMKALLENPEVKTIGGYDVAYQRGFPIGKTPNINMLKMANDNEQAGLERSNKITLKGMGTTGSGAAGKPATPSMERITAALDPYFGFSSRDDADKKRRQHEQRKWITAAAMANMQDGRAKSETEAVRQAVEAFKQKGFTIVETKRKSTNNPPSGKKTLGVF